MAFGEISQGGGTPDGWTAERTAQRVAETQNTGTNIGQQTNEESIAVGRR